MWIQDYAAIVNPLTRQLRKGMHFEWGDEAEKAFEVIKRKITESPPMKPIDYKCGRPAFLSVDMSNIAVGAILSQEDENGRRRPAYYASFTIGKTEGEKYPQDKLELFGLHKAMEAFKDHIYQLKNLTIEVDAKYLKGVLKNPSSLPDRPMNWWIANILRFSPKIVHVPAAQFKGPDALSRRPRVEDEENVVYYDYKKQGSEQVNDGAAKDGSDYDVGDDVVVSAVSIQDQQEKSLKDIKAYLKDHSTLPATASNADKKRFIRKSAGFFLIRGELYKHNGSATALRVLEAETSRQNALVNCHDELGHKGEVAVYRTLQQRVYWPRMRADVHAYVASCHECQIRKTTKVLREPTISTPNAIFQKVHLDVMNMPLCQGYKFIICAKDDLSGMVEARALKTNNAKSIERFFHEQIYCRYGRVGTVITDNGSETRKEFEEAMKRLHIPQIRITPYNKRANGVVERGHFILRESIVKACEKGRNGVILKWPIHLPMAVFAHNVTVSAATGYSPYYLVHGVEPTLALDLAEQTLMTEGYRANMSTIELLTQRIRHLMMLPEDVQKAAKTLQKARMRSKAQFMSRYEHKIQNKIFKQNDLVLVRNTAIDMSLTRMKTEPRYLGPYRVEMKTTQGNYVLAELNGTVLARPIAKFRVIPYFARRSPEMMEILRNVQAEEEEESENEGSESGEDNGID
jgi:hypothetical protein